jgi:uncharacterized RDD family membrane protein YckC
MKKINDIFFNLYFNINKPKTNAGFILRFFAFMIDLTILSILNYFLISTFDLEVTVHNKTFNPIFLISHPYSIVVNWLYFSILESNPNYQATIGKSLLKLKVVNANDTKISFGQATGRFFAKIISGAIIGIGFFMIAFTKNRQGLHDLAAGTFVKIKY